MKIDREIFDATTKEVLSEMGGSEMLDQATITAKALNGLEATAATVNQTIEQKLNLQIRDNALEGRENNTTILNNQINGTLGPLIKADILNEQIGKLIQEFEQAYQQNNNGEENFLLAFQKMIELKTLEKLRESKMDPSAIPISENIKKIEDAIKRESIIAKRNSRRLSRSASQNQEQQAQPKKKKKLRLGKKIRRARARAQEKRASRRSRRESGSELSESASSRKREVDEILPDMDSSDDDVVILTKEEAEREAAQEAELENSEDDVIFLDPTDAHVDDMPHEIHIQLKGYEEQQSEPELTADNVVDYVDKMFADAEAEVIQEQQGKPEANIPAAFRDAMPDAQSAKAKAEQEQEQEAKREQDNEDDSLLVY